VVVASILIMAPAAFHRLGREREPQERFHLASVVVMCELIPLSLSIRGDLFIIVWKVTRSVTVAARTGRAAVFVFAVLAQVIPLVSRERGGVSPGVQAARH